MGAVTVNSSVVDEKDDCPPKPPTPKPPKPDDDCCEKSYTVEIHFH